MNKIECETLKLGKVKNKTKVISLIAYVLDDLEDDLRQKLEKGQFRARAQLYSISRVLTQILQKKQQKI